MGDLELWLDSRFDRVLFVGDGLCRLMVKAFTGFNRLWFERLKALAGQLSVYWFFRPWFYGICLTGYTGLCFRQVEGWIWLRFLVFQAMVIGFWLETAGCIYVLNAGS